MGTLQIEEIEDEGKTICTVWFDDKKEVKRGEFNVATLSKYERIKFPNVSKKEDKFKNYM